MIIGTKEKPIQDILRDFKSFTSRKLKEEILNNAEESRKKWLLWMMRESGKRNGNNNDWSRRFKDFIGAVDLTLTMRFCLSYKTKFIC